MAQLCKILCQTIVIDQATILSLVARYEVIFAIILEFGAMYSFPIPHVSFALRLNYVFGYVQPHGSVDRSDAPSIKSCLGCHNPDVVAEKSCPACTGMRYERFIR